MINILYQFNDKYAPFAGVSIVSLFCNLQTEEKVRIFLLGEEVSSENEEKLLQQIEGFGGEGVFMDAEELCRRLSELGLNTYRGTNAANFKLFAAEVLPKDVDRLLYIDCDTLIEGDIAVTYGLDLKGCTIGMSQDSVCAQHKKTLGFAKEEPYYNSGIILFDLESWRQNHCTNLLEEHLQTERSHYMAPDQDLLNVIFKGKICDLGIAHNLQPFHMAYSYKQYVNLFGASCYYGEEEVTEGAKNPVILHTFRFLGEFPWHKDSVHPSRDLFDGYLAQSMWADYERTVTDQDDFVFRVERWMYRCFPKGLFLFVFKICYELFLWRAERDSRKQKNNERM